MNFNNLEKREIKVGNIDREILFDVLDELPSGKRLYKDIGKVFVRGLFYGEVLEASKIDENNLNETLRVYRDAIKFENANYKLEDLEIVDYILLTSIVNIMTTPDFKWFPSFTCENIIENPKIKLADSEIEELNLIKNQLKEDLKDENISDETIEMINNDLKDLDKQIENLKIQKKEAEDEPFVECGAVVSNPITLDDFEIDIKDQNLTFPVFYNFSGVELELAPLTIKDVKDYKNEIDEISSYSSYIKNFDENDSFNLIKNSFPYDVEKLENYIERFKIQIKPFKVKCNKCGKEYKLEIDLKDIKVLP